MIMISNVAIVNGKGNDGCYLEFNKETLIYHPPKAVSSALTELKPVKGAIDHNRSFKNVSRVYFCGQVNQSAKTVFVKGESFDCDSASLKNDTKSKSNSSDNIDFWYTSEIQNPWFRSNKLYFNEMFPHEYTHYYWPVQECIKSGKCVDTQRQAIFLFKTDQINIQNANKRKECINSSRPLNPSIILRIYDIDIQYKVNNKKELDLHGEYSINESKTKTLITGKVKDFDTRPLLHANNQDLKATIKRKDSGNIRTKKHSGSREIQGKANEEYNDNDHMANKTIANVQKSELNVSQTGAGKQNNGDRNNGDRNNVIKGSHKLAI